MKAPRTARRAATAIVCFLLGTGTGSAGMFLVEHRDRAQPAWLGLFAAGALTAAAAADGLSRRRAPQAFTTLHHQHETHGGRPGQGRTRVYRNR
ncbi:hypothetical protein HUT16_17145 [Kitasatospora sp. NA04385]|uniref:hypothetical protein n=1 Tax=Kitasatospora sp. NA04385 TaxID=2742135 RepID=UPI00159134C2|nr:hypothetical protein [Kitasatospora sp. NA04385]QKW20564.1 hypothetical protein HUT16_17145 [Kitasatospora sp. NA04385]